MAGCGCFEVAACSSYALCARPSRGLHTAVAAAIIASTVLVKRHYVVDLIAGAPVCALTPFCAQLATVTTAEEDGDLSAAALTAAGDSKGAV